MLFIELAHGVGHFGFQPDAELDAVFLGITQESFDTFGQFTFVHCPVAETAVVGLAGVFVAEPSVVHDEEFTAHGGDVAHHLVHSLLIDVEVHAFPGIQENVSWLVAVHQFVFTSPLMEVARGTAESLIGIGECQDGSDKGLSLGQLVFRVVFIDAGIQIVVFCIVGLHLEAIVAAVTESGANHSALVLLWFPVE